MLSDRCLSVCPVYLSVTLVYCGQMVGWIKMKLGMQVGLGLGHIVLDWEPAELPSPKRGRSPQFSAHICYDQMAGCIKMPLGREIGLSPSDIMLDRDPAPPRPKGAEPQFSSHVYCGQKARWHLVRRYASAQRSDVVLDGKPAPLSKRCTTPSFRPMSVVAKRLYG